METNDVLHATLLQLIAHDLLTPLTALKWQAELLARDGEEGSGSKKYIAGIRESAEVSVALIERVTALSTLLAGNRTARTEPIVLPDMLRASWDELATQYARHGVVLDCSFDPEEAHRKLDRELVQVFLWVVGKFFLACVPAKETVTVRGLRLEGAEGADVAQLYTMTVSAKSACDIKTQVELLSHRDAPITLPEHPAHTDIFLALVHRVADEGHLSYSVGVEGDVFTLELSFGVGE